MVVRLAGEKFEREAGGFRSVARFVRRSEGDDRIEPLTLQSFAVELGFTAGRGEVALGEGEEGCRAFCRAHPPRQANTGLDGGPGSLGWTAGGGRRYVVRGAFEIQADARLAFQPLTGNPFEPRIGRLQSVVDHGIHRFAETVVVKTHAL